MKNASEPQDDTGIASGQSDTYIETMSEADIKRLEERIEAISREGQLRLDATIARLEGTLGVISEKLTHTATKGDIDAISKETGLLKQRLDSLPTLSKIGVVVASISAVLAIIAWGIQHIH